MNNVDRTLSALKASVERLTMLEKRHRNLLDSLNDGFAIVNNGLQILQLNSAFAHMLGYDYEQITGKNLLSFAAHQSDQIALLNGISRRIDKQKDSYDLNFRTKDGRIVTTNINPTPYLGDGDKVIGSFAVIKDLTDIIKAENTLEYQAHLLDHISEGVIVTDEKGNIEYWNSTAKNMLGFIATCSLNLNIFDILPLDKDFYINIFANNKQVYTESEFTTPSGIQRYLRLSTALLDNKHSQETGTVTIISDLTELIISRQQAEQASQAKTNFLATTSHDIRTPMIGIIGASDLLLQENLNDYQKDLVTTVQQSGQQLLDLINNILDISKIEAGYTAEEIKPFNLLELITECTSTIYAKIKANNLDLFIEIEPSIPLVLVGDTLQIKRIILNLLCNAVTFTESGYIKISIMPIDVYEANDNKINLLFSIEDSGSGIPNDELAYIFDAFHQVNHHSSIGTGLGLNICKKLVENMGGQIWASSQVGKGSEFSFYIPVEKTDINTNDSYVPLLTSTWENISPHKKNILIVEDNKVNSKILTYMLKNIDYESLSVKNGKECLAILEKHDFDLILMDMQMPVLDGYKTTKIIRKNYKKPDIPIIALTAFAMNGDAKRCIEAGCDYYLPKPVNIASLSLALDKLLSDKQDKVTVMSETLIDSLIPEFISSVKDLFEQLETAIDSNNYEIIKNITHDLKGICGMYGFIGLSEASALVNQYANKLDDANLKIAFNNLKQIFKVEIKY
ncbi:MAG TPA: PAS domain S-box protein [Syntrophomonadaceae bacterium]|nr:PAS domain S-box protein [Syntrophomonadaceae bacterium]